MVIEFQSPALLAAIEVEGLDLFAEVGPLAQK
jgi:hypothetical protein